MLRSLNMPIGIGARPQRGYASAKPMTKRGKLKRWEPHWKSEASRREAASKGLTDKMTAGKRYVNMVPIYEARYD